MERRTKYDDLNIRHNYSPNSIKCIESETGNDFIMSIPNISSSGDLTKHFSFES